MKHSVWYFAFEKRKLVLKKYPVKKIKRKKMNVLNSSKLTQSSELKKTKRKKKK